MPMDRVRINTEIPHGLTARERAERPAVGAEKGAFRARLAEAQSLQLNERIDGALKDIEELGARLGQTLSLADLKRYRTAISALLKDLTTNMVQVRTQMEWDSQSWEHRTLITIRKIDAELEKLTEMVISQEQDRLAILERMGEIKGLLLDLRF